MVTAVSLGPSTVPDTSDVLQVSLSRMNGSLSPPAVSGQRLPVRDLSPACPQIHSRNAWSTPPFSSMKRPCGSQPHARAPVDPRVIPFLHSTADPVNTHGYLKSELATHTYTSTCTHSPCLQALWAAPTYLSSDPSLPVLFFLGGGSLSLELSSLSFSSVASPRFNICFFFFP